MTDELHNDIINDLKEIEAFDPTEQGEELPVIYPLAETLIDFIDTFFYEMTQIEMSGSSVQNHPWCTTFFEINNRQLKFRFGITYFYCDEQTKDEDPYYSRYIHEDGEDIFLYPSDTERLMIGKYVKSRREEFLQVRNDHFVKLLRSKINKKKRELVK